jgi:hypothetical protein
MSYHICTESTKKVLVVEPHLEETAGAGLDRIRVGVSHLCGSIGIPRETLKQELNLSETPQIWVEKCDEPCL